MRLARRTATAAIAVALAVAGLAAAGAGCDLDANGIGDADGAAGGPDTGIDVGLDTGRDVGAGGDAGDGASDAGAADVGGDGFDACAPIETDCLNGVDDDCNGHTDCDDPACQVGYTCAPIPTGGWQGYSLYDDDRSAACPAGYPAQSDAFEGLIALPATCGACGCGGASGSKCGATVNVSCAPTAACTVGATTATVANQCTTLATAIPVAATDFCQASPPTPSSGSCPPLGGIPSKPAVSFSKLSRVCASARSGGGCTAGNVCVPRPTGTSHGVCVSQPLASAALCPLAYSHAHVVSLSGTVTDGRGCTACTCTPALGVTCSSQVTLHTAPGCAEPDGGLLDDAGAALGTDPATIPADGTCRSGVVTAAEVFVSGLLTATVTSQGACTAGVATPTGTVTPSPQTQYCCQN